MKKKVRKFVSRLRCETKAEKAIAPTKSAWMEKIEKIGPIDFNNPDKPYVGESFVSQKILWFEHPVLSEKKRDDPTWVVTPRG